MKRNNLIVLLIVCLTSLVHLQAQDIHFTNNHIVPTYFNPAQIGAFQGTYRAGLNIRDQWRPHSSAPYTSAGIFVDSPIIFGLTDQQWVGVGATLFYDRAGEVRQTWSGFYPGVSYHIGLDKKFRNVITIGAQYGFSNRGYDPMNALTEWIALGNNSDPDIESITAMGNENFSVGYGDLNIGFLYKGKLDKVSKVEIGASVMHLLNPTVRIVQQGGRENAIGLRSNAHIIYRRAVSPQMIWEPSAFVSMMPGANNIMVQLRNEYLLKKRGDLSIITGVGMRFGDSAQLLLGANYKGYIFSFAYDHVISSLTEGGYVAAYELGITRIFTVNKKPKVKPIIYCPRL